MRLPALNARQTLSALSRPHLQPTGLNQIPIVPSDRQFREDFLKVVAHEVAKNFYRHDLKEDMALDATYISNR